MTIDNFKNIEHLEQPFGDVVNVRGANETGKTTFADAISWCLTGKNSLGEPNPNIVPVDKQETSPTVTLEVLLDNRPATISRCYQAKFNREKEYTGEHQTVCFINGLKQNIKDFDTWIERNICDKEIFRLLYDVKYFTENIATTAKEKKWEVQRRLLFAIANIKPDVDLAKKRKKFLPLVEDLERNGSIAVCMRTRTDYQKNISDKIKSINEKLNWYDERIATLTEPLQGETVEQLQQKINDLENAKQEIYKKYKQEKERYQTGQQQFSKKMYDLSSAKTICTREMQECKQTAFDLREQVASIYEYCPTCGAKMDEEQNRCQHDQINTKLAEYQQRYLAVAQKLKKIEAQIAETEKQDIWHLPELPQDYIDIDKKIKELSKIEFCIQEINTSKKVISDLENNCTILLEAKAQNQQMLDLCKEFVDYKCDQASKKINDMFDGITFELFKPNKTNDEVKECCNIFWQGVPYESLSYSTKFIASLKIVLAFQKHYNVFLPIVVDNAESFDYIQPLDRQIIKLTKEDERCPKCGNMLMTRKQADGLWHCSCGHNFKKTLKILASNYNLLS